MRKKKSWDNPWYTAEFLQELKNTARVVMDGDLPILQKYAPDAISDIGMDPRMLGGTLGKNAKVLALIPEKLVNSISYKMDERWIANFRAGCDKIASANCHTKGVLLEDRKVVAKDGYEIPIRIYRDGKCSPKGKCLYFMHGGGFIGGGIPPYDEGWKVFVEKFHIVVISVEYRLLPENPYPAAHEDCWTVLNWIHHHAEELDIDPAYVYVTGDSAGGNLAQYCSTRAKGTGMVRAQMLLYGSFNMFQIEDKYYKPGSHNFNYEPKQKRLSRCITLQLEMYSGGARKVIGVEEPDDWNNPYTSDPAGNPPTFISVGALDFLKIDGIAWAHKLHDAGVPIKVVMYNGMGHGYLNAVGVFPQAEDVIDEMGQFMSEY